jgi:hypothetical protein
LLIYIELECRLELINEKLRLKGDKLIKQYESPEEVVSDAISTENSAVLLLLSVRNRRKDTI